LPTTDPPAGPTAVPAAALSFASSGSGGFSGSPCALVAGSTSSSCSVTYTPTGAGSHQITASYSPSGSVHDSSADASGVSVTVRKRTTRTEEHGCELSSRPHLVCTLCPETVAD